ncbi:MAG: alpha/beta hydrolase [Alphaproteobacteria bacterium]|nr:alpha/beta hydrolase [Alphaproteobacteria bacterium]
MTNSLITDRDRFTTAHPETRMDLNGRDWGVRDVGHGPELLLIPGTLGRGDIFWHQIESLSDRLRIVTVSYPSVGGVAEWAQDMVTLLDRLEIKAASVLGSSLGGYVAQFMAGNCPDRMSYLIAANTLHSVSGLSERMPYALDLAAAPITDLRAGFAEGLGAWATAHPDQRELVELLLQESGGRILEPELRARLAALKHGPELPPLALAPDRVISVDAVDDPLIPPEMRQAVRERLTPSVAYRFSHGGHFPYVARPAYYTAMLEQVMGLTVTGPDWGDGPLRER